MMSAVHPLSEALLQSALDPMWIVGAARSLVRFNRPFARMFEELHGRTPVIGEITNELFEEPWPSLLARTLSGRSISTDASFFAAGLLRSFTITGTPVIESTIVTHVVFSARELEDSQRGARENLFELSLTRLFIDDERPLIRTLHAALEYVCESDEWDCGAIWLVGEDDSTVLEPAAVYASSSLPHGEELPDHLRDVRFPRGRGLPGRAWAEADILWISDIGEDSNVTLSWLSQRIGLHGAIAVPLRDGPRIVGVLELFTRSVRPVDDRRARALLRIGAGLGRLIERRRGEDERRHLIQVIERKGLEWSLTFDAIELPIFITTMEGVVRRMNRAGRDLAGGDYPDVLGRRVRSFGLHEPWTTLSACVEAVRDSGETCSAQAYEPESDRSWDITANSYHPANESQRVILIARETTSVVRLQNAVKRGEQLSALGELVAGVAHEVRNPIFGMQITVDALEGSIPRNQEAHELLQVMHRWLDRLNRLMESLLAYGRTWTIDLRPGSIADVLRQAVEGTEPVAANASVQLSVSIDANATILMDASRLVHAFENLLTNAIQHTRANGVVELTAFEDERFIECRVRDYGPGFERGDLPRIFEPFFTRRRGGTGLGLAIVQRIVDEHGGTVDAENAEGGGALITVRFPIYSGK